MCNDVIVFYYKTITMFLQLYKKQYVNFIMSHTVAKCILLEFATIMPASCSYFTPARSGDSGL